MVVQHEYDLTIKGRSRRAVREELVGVWLKEEPGNFEETHAYRYDVERLGDGNRIYLRRPTRLNKGMDFVIYCDGFRKWKQGTTKPPKHIDLFDELDAITSVAINGSKNSVLLRNGLFAVWNCESPDEWIKENKESVDIVVERVLKVARWFFIEQDLTYWTQSGRWMLRRAIEERIGPLE